MSLCQIFLFNKMRTNGSTEEMSICCLGGESFKNFLKAINRTSEISQPENEATKYDI